MSILGSSNKRKTKMNVPKKSTEVKKSTSSKKKANPGTVIAVGKQVYDGSVVTRALKRAGKNKNLKGHAFEIMTCDRHNSNVKNIIQGKKAVLTKSPTAIRDDIVVKQGKKVVGRMQLKDTPKGINDTVKKVSSGQYKGTKLVGTKETKKAYDAAVATKNTHGANITQKMKTNGISSADTELIQAKALGGNVIKNGRVIAGQAAKTGATSAAVSGGIAAISNVRQVAKGEKTKSEAVVDVAREAGTGAVSGIVANAAGTAATVLVAATPAAPAAVVAGVVVSAAAGYAADAGCRKAGQYIQDKTSQMGNQTDTKFTPVLN